MWTCVGSQRPLLNENAVNNKSSATAVPAAWQCFQKLVWPVAIFVANHVPYTSDPGDLVASIRHSHVHSGPYLNNIPPHQFSHWHRLSTTNGTTALDFLSRNSHAWSQRADTFSSISIAKGRSQSFDHTGPTAFPSSPAFDASRLPIRIYTFSTPIWLSVSFVWWLFAIDVHIPCTTTQTVNMNCGVWIFRDSGSLCYLQNKSWRWVP